MLQTVRAEKVDKKWVICLVSMVLKLPKKVLFLRYGTDLSQNFKSVKAIYIYASESFLSLFQIFGKKLLIWTAHNTFLEGRHPEVTKNPYYISSTHHIIFFRL